MWEGGPYSGVAAGLARSPQVVGRDGHLGDATHRANYTLTTFILARLLLISAHPQKNVSLRRSCGACLRRPCGAGAPRPLKYPEVPRARLRRAPPDPAVPCPLPPLCSGDPPPPPPSPGPSLVLVLLLGAAVCRLGGCGGAVGLCAHWA
jgi:hypothetical protein